ncbi:N-acetylmuramoyl-L-alanine amidase [Mucilaginibacter sp. HMF5004]|uniref:N-acetylmuramoyl-L-alanine amidase family protein n=1 Tax=Mucilaginibacter rivuli TaxID=2857527 RepID=UPI001C5E2A10|nr:N-acetylmuramoyl-L-alanine amidase [Mucilaginibacter rivuli]MBW4889583.1 N-acetylmuramoyl-L-alanine amidase [Mucilaginibacter rivuli]
MSAVKSYSFTAAAKTDTSAFRVKTIVVDAGHGGHTGASGSYSTEEQVTLALALKLQKAIQKDLKDVKVVMTRTTPDGVGLQKRSDIANDAKGDLFISIHCNSLPDRTRIVNGRKVRSPDQSGRGVLLLVYGLHRDKEEVAALRENLFEETSAKGGNGLGFDPHDPGQMIILNAFKQKFRKNSILFANLVNDEFVQTDGRSSDGVKEQGVLVLCHTAMPAVLVETGFINNPKDEEYLNSEDGQNEIVASIVRAIKSYKKEIEPI